MGGNCNVGIGGLPPAAANLQPGRLYAVLVARDEYLPNLLLGTLALSTGTPATLVAGSDPQELLACAGTDAHHLQQGLATGATRILLAPTERDSAVPKARRTQQLLDELGYFRVPRDSLVVIDRAERYLEESDTRVAAREIDRLMAWSIINRQIVLLLLHRPEQRGTLLATLMECSDRFAGMGRLSLKGEAPQWTIQHWHSREGVMVNHGFTLEIDGDGRLALPKGAILDASHLSDLAFDEATVYIAAGAIKDSHGVRKEWRVVPDNSDLEEATAEAVAATVVLHYDAATNLREVANIVFRLRRRRGPRIKIIVREMNTHLRYKFEQMLLRVGANLMVPMEIGFSKFLNMLDGVQGQSFLRELDTDIETAMAAAAQEDERGYLPPLRFVEAAVRVVEQSRPLDLENVLTRLGCRSGMQPVDALRLFRLRRPGDVCSADADSVYIFLHACREADTDLALERVFGLPVSELFQEETRFLSPESIFAELEAMQRRARRDEVPDHTKALETVQEAGSASAPPLEPLVVRRVPTPAIRHPLRLKAKEEAHG